MNNAELTLPGIFVGFDGNFNEDTGNYEIGVRASKCNDGCQRYGGIIDWRPNFLRTSTETRFPIGSSLKAIIAEIGPEFEGIIGKFKAGLMTLAELSIVSGNLQLQNLAKLYEQFELVRPGSGFKAGFYGFNLSDDGKLIQPDYLAQKAKILPLDKFSLHKLRGLGQMPNNLPNHGSFLITHQGYGTALLNALPTSSDRVEISSLGYVTGDSE